MRLLVFGKSGQLARELFRAAPSEVNARFLSRAEADLADARACAAAVCNADAVINAAAFTAVDRAESEEHDAFRINAEAPGAIARACAAQGIPFLHVSTDHVFAGDERRPMLPGDAPRPVNAYGRSKLAGEEAVRASGARHVILRTSWVFSASGSGFLQSILRLGRKQEGLRVVADQIGGPTPAAALARALMAAAWAMRQGHAGGTHHFVGAPDVSRADFARAILAEAGLACRIDEASSTDVPVPARRPLDARLDCQSFLQAFGIARPCWRTALRDVMKELENH